MGPVRPRRGHCADHWDAQQTFIYGQGCRSAAGNDVGICCYRVWSGGSLAVPLPDCRY